MKIDFKNLFTDLSQSDQNTLIQSAHLHREGCPALTFAIAAGCVPAPEGEVVELEPGNALPETLRTALVIQAQIGIVADDRLETIFNRRVVYPLIEIALATHDALALGVIHEKLSRKRRD